MSEVTRSLRNFFSRIEQTTKEAISKKQMQHLGDFTVDLIVKRTRLGYGVDIQFGDKAPLKPLHPNYISFRKEFENLSDTTRPKKSNLTLTGQMLLSVKAKAENGTIKIAPTGNRTDTDKTNLQIAAFNQRRGRTFNRVSKLEYNQMLREFRRMFGDLLRKKQLLK